MSVPVLPVPSVPMCRTTFLCRPPDDLPFSLETHLGAVSLTERSLPLYFPLQVAPGSPSWCVKSRTISSPRFRPIRLRRARTSPVFTVCASCALVSVPLTLSLLSLADLYSRQSCRALGCWSGALKGKRSTGSSFFFLQRYVRLVEG